VRPERECAHGFRVTFWVTDRNAHAVLERGAGQGLDVALPTIEFALGPVEELEHKSFEITEVVAKQSVDLAGYAGILERFLIWRRRQVRLVLAGEAREAVGGRHDPVWVATEVGDLVGQQAQKALEHRVPAFARRD